MSTSERNRIVAQVLPTRMTGARSARANLERYRSDPVGLPEERFLLDDLLDADGLEQGLQIERIG
jgi:hypothetical protein